MTDPHDNPAPEYSSPESQQPQGFEGGAEHVSHTHDHGHDAHAAPGESSYSESELAALRRDDIAAGRAVVTLMTSIFLIGIFIYSIVLYSVIS